MKTAAIDHLGTTVSTDNQFKKRMRIHQGWWRAFVLLEEEGFNPRYPGLRVCSTIKNGKSNSKNFLSSNIAKAVNDTLKARDNKSRGMINEDRLFNNLLSSQPLCFNFFGELKHDLKLAAQILKAYYPLLDEVTDVVFEYSPCENYTNDNSAFDVAFIVRMNGMTGLIGWECKFTDSFSQYIQDKESYQMIYKDSRAFSADYEEFFKPELRQLFRNQLIAEASVLHKKFDFAYTGLFCHQDDEDSIKTGKKFQNMIKDGTARFSIINYQNYIENLQKKDLPWNLREYSMLLWARYCALELSREVFISI